MSELNDVFRHPQQGMAFPCLPEFIQTDPEKNTLTFTVQEEPIAESGINGCQIDHVIWAITIIIRSFNSKFPCRENSLAITKLEEAMMWLEKRTRDREGRRVEGTNQP